MGGPLHYLEIAELAERIAAREITAVAATSAQLERITALDGALRSYAFIAAESALAAAAAADAEISAGFRRGPLHGVPLALKDLCWTRDMPSAGGMPIHRNFLPPVDATVVERLKSAGAVILGKLQMTEGAYSDHHPSIEPPRNPWNPDYWTGISSSGAAAATAAGLCYGALASDTGGSIRWPCGATGLTGLKPSSGRVSRFGIFELAGSLDHIGPIARSARDTGVIFDAIAGYDARDPASLHLSMRDPLAAAAIAGLRIGVDRLWNTEDVDPAVALAMIATEKVFRDAGAEIVEVDAPEIGQAVIDWALICAVEAAAAHAPDFPSRRGEYGPVLSAVLDRGRAACALDFHAAQRRRQVLTAEFRDLLAGLDLLLAPVQPFAPLTLERIRTLGKQPELILRLQRYTAPFNLTGLPTLTLPGGFSAENMPVGVQLIGSAGTEWKLIRVGTAVQAITSWHRAHPVL